MSLPSTPNAGTGITAPLVTVAQYRQITKDLASTPEDVQDELDEAVTTLSMQCNRTFPYGQYTEDLYLYNMGMVFPSATPLDATKMVISGADNTAIYDPAQGQNPSSVIQGAGIWVGFFTPLPWMPVWTGVIPPQTVVTYWGGYRPYQDTSGPTAGLPPRLARILCTIAYYTLNPSVVTAMGAKSTAMGGISLAGDLSSFMQFDKNLRRMIRGFTRPAAHAWQN